jgi:crossover junction endodeoxyribonuclease RuvC
VIAGVDASLSSFGLALPDGHLATLKPRAGADDIGRRLDQLDALFERTLRLHPPLPALILIEAYASNSKGIVSTLRLAELGGVIRRRLFRLDIPYLAIGPSQLKRYATGQGNCDKDAMVEAARVLGGRPRNHDEADAFLLRHLGRAAYGLEPLATRHAKEVVAAIRWPHLWRTAETPLCLP